MIEKSFVKLNWTFEIMIREDDIMKSW
jgi:hypothetical protein